VSRNQLDNVVSVNVSVNVSEKGSRNKPFTLTRENRLVFCETLH